MFVNIMKFVAMLCFQSNRANIKNSPVVQIVDGCYE